MSLPPFFRRAFIALSLSLILIGVGCFTPPSAVADPAVMENDSFTVSNVAVDITAASAAEANTKALLEGQMTAARQILERLTPESEHNALPALDQQTVLNLVRYVAVDEEKRSSVRYIARLTIHFNPTAVRALIAAKKLTFVEPSALPVLIIPVFQEGPETPLVLWEDNNPWRAVWARRVGAGSLVPIELPLGDLADIGALTAQQAAMADPQALAAMAKRQGVDDVLVVHAVVAPVAPLSIDVRLVRPSRPGDAEVSRFTAEPGETLPILLDKAAESVVVWLEEAWKHGSAVPFNKNGFAGANGKGGQLTAMVPLSSLDDWMAVRRALSRIREVKRVEVQALKRDMAQIIISTDGDATTLASSLLERGYALASAGEVWTLTRASSSPTPQQAGQPAPQQAGQPGGKP